MKITYLSEIINALESLGGCGSLKEINHYIESHNILPDIKSNKNWKDNVRATIQRHCSETGSYRGAEDIFYSVYGLGEGYWGLKSMKYTNLKQFINPIDERLENLVYSDTSISVTEKEMIIQARIGQGIFRENIIKKYTKCIITGITDKRLLVASHIKPWRSSNNIERLSSENGLLLSPLYDKLFDIGLISFDKNMKIIISQDLSKNNINKLYIDKNITYIKSPSTELKHNMEYHRELIFKG